MADPTLDVMTAKVRKLEVRVAQLEDAIQVYGPPQVAKPSRIPELSREQKHTLAFALAFGLLLVMGSVKDRRATGVPS